MFYWATQTNKKKTITGLFFFFFFFFTHHAFRKSQKATFPYELHSIMTSAHLVQKPVLKKQKKHTQEIKNCHKQNTKIYRIAASVSFLKKQKGYEAMFHK